MCVCPTPSRDFVTFSVVFLVNISVGAEVGIAAGVVLSWLLTLALPYGQPVKIQALLVCPAPLTPHTPTALGGPPVCVYDLSQGSYGSGHGAVVTVIKPKFPFVFANCDKLKVRWLCVSVGAPRECVCECMCPMCV